MLTTSPTPQSLHSRVATALRGFGPVSVVVSLLMALSPIVEPLNALAVPIWIWLSRISWKDVGCARPPSWAATLVGGSAFGVGLKLLMKAVVMPLFGAPAVSAGLHQWVGHPVVLPSATLVAVVGAGWGEESVFRGFLFERGRKLLGNGAAAKVTMVLVSAGAFGGLHYFVQGFVGAVQATIFGLVFAAIFALTDSLWFLVVAHAGFDIATVFIVVFNVEAAVAHAVFR